MKNSQLLFMLLAITFFPLVPMDLGLPFTEIEKQLISQEIERSGKDSLMAAIKAQAETEWYTDIERQVRCRQKISFLTIEKDFYKDQIGKNPLTLEVFKSVKEREASCGYCPEIRIIEIPAATLHDRPTNFLGEHSRYFWIKRGEVIKQNMQAVDGEAIRVEFKCYKKKPLIIFIENYTK